MVKGLGKHRILIEYRFLFVTFKDSEDELLHPNEYFFIFFLIYYKGAL